jgi:predicted nuclease with TOPRIM domain
MTAYNVVRMKVKPGHDKEFIDLNSGLDPEIRERFRKNGLRRFTVIKTAERAYCIIGEWENFDGIVKSRPDLIKTLDGYRPILEDLGNGLGMTDPVSGEAVVDIKY